jgi:hypothetical protein
VIRATRSHHRLLSIETLEDRCCPSSLSPPTLTSPDAATQAQISHAYGQLPLAFVANQGQTDAQVNFLTGGTGYTLFLTPTQAVLDMQHAAGNSPRATESVLRLQLLGSNPKAQAVGLDALASTSNYLMGNDPGQWHAGIANFGQVEYQGVYPGIDMLYHGNQGHLEYDFDVAPGADPNVIRLSFKGARGLSLNATGDLVVHTSAGNLVEQAPVLYQVVGGVRQAVTGHYILRVNGQVGFRVGAYDRTRPLIIDPTYSLVYSTYLGGSGGDHGYAIAVDASGDTYITGETNSLDFPTTSGVVQPADHSSTVKGKPSATTDVFVTKLNATGTGLVYSTYLGGSDMDVGDGIAVDSAGNAYVTGKTYSMDFPTKNAFQPTKANLAKHPTSNLDAFVFKLNATGSALLYSSYLGGTGNENSGVSNGAPVGGIAVDDSGNAYLTGETGSSDFPTTSNAYQRTYGAMFVTKVNTNLSGAASLVYSTYFGSNYPYHGGIALDGSDNVYITGDGSFASPFFVAKLNLNLSGAASLVYSTYVGDGQSYGIAVDSSGNAYVAGWTSSPSFPITANAFQTTPGSASEVAFVTVLNATGSGLIYSTYLGGVAYSGDGTEGHAIAVDGAGHVYITGYTTAPDFPTLYPFQASLAGYSNAFVAELDPFATTGAASLIYSSYLGGNDQDSGYGIAVDGTGNAYVTGAASSNNFPTTAGAFQSSLKGQYNAFVTKIDPPA